MLCAGGLRQPLCNSFSNFTTIPHKLVSPSLLCSYTTHQLILSPLSNASPFASIFTGRRGFYVSASEKRRGENSGLVEMEGSDSDGDDEGEDLPLGYMRKWIANKPRGFGEGKAYDTSLEDKLMEEIEQSRQAQLANINNLKNNPLNSSIGQLPAQKAPEFSPSGVRVRVLNLPKKKNIHRDLRNVFKGFPGFINVIPAVSGNKKTKDPICKGFAFVDLKSSEDANRFIQTFSGQSISFGKVEKQIKCEIVNPPAPDSACKQPANGTHSASKPAIASAVEVARTDAGSNPGNVSMDSPGEVKSDESNDPDNSVVSEKFAEFEEDQEHDCVLKANDGDGTKRDTDPPTTSSSSSKRPSGPATTKKKKLVKKKAERFPKPSIPGSALRLRVKEKAVLTDVFSKYGTNHVVSS